jgi:hypothetical protein
MQRTQENIVSSFFYYMWNGWGSQEECRKVFDWNANHFWEKWVSLFREDRLGAVERFYAALSPDNRKKLVDRACEVYNGGRRKEANTV